MLAANEAQVAHEWVKYKGYTIRPLPSTIAYYEKLIGSLAHKINFLMYGATPEIRTIFQQLDLEVLLVDKSEKMIRAMGLLTQDERPIANNEHYLIADWLNLESLPCKFDLIIGDDAINMVSWDNFDLFLHNSARLIHEKGQFICHLLVKPDDDLIDKDLEDLINEYKIGEIKSLFDLASRINFTCFDKNNYSMGWQSTIETLGEERLSLLDPIMNFVDIFGRCNSKFYCPPQIEFEKLVRKYFTIDEIFYPTEHKYCLFEPIYLLTKK